MNRRSLRAGVTVTSLLVAMGSGHLAADESRLFPAETNVPPAAVFQYVMQDAVREDLKLTDEQQTRIAECQKEHRGTRLLPDDGDPRAVLDRRAEESEKAQTALSEILTEAQARRHLQISLQQAIAFGVGLSGSVELTEIGDALSLTHEQQEQIEGIRQDVAAATLEMFRARRPPTARRFHNVDVMQAANDRRNMNAEANRRTSDVLTREQKQQLLESLGPPLARNVAPVFFMRARPQLPPPGAIGARGGGLRGGMVVSPPLLQPRSLRPTPVFGGESLAESSWNAGLLASETVQKELQVSPDQVRQKVLLGAEAAELTRSVRELSEWLEPPQLERLRQLVLQVSVDKDGPAAALIYREVVEALHLTSTQRARLEEAVNRELQSNRAILLRSVEFDPERCHEIEKNLEEDLYAVLTAEQRDCLKRLVGKPPAANISRQIVERSLSPRLSPRARVTKALGELAVRNAFELLRYEGVRNELQLTDEQREALGSSMDVTRKRDEVLEVLTDAQKKRLSEINLQREVRQSGPAAVFWYRPAIDELALDEDQQRQVLKIVHDDLRGYLRIPLDELEEKLPELDVETAQKLDSVLTAEQREKLAALLGEPSPSIESPGLPVR